MKKLFLWLLLLSSPLAFGQGVFVPPQVALKTVNGTTMPIAGATITVCAKSVSGIPCSPALSNTIFSDLALTQPLSNPFPADASGNYQFAVAQGTYTVTVSASGFAGYSYQVSAGNGASLSQNAATVGFSATPTFTAVAQNQLFKMTLTGNVTSSALVMTAVAAPAIVTFELIQDNTGNRSFVWPANVIGGSTILNLFAGNNVLSQSFFWDGSNAVAVGPVLATASAVGNFNVPNIYSCGSTSGGGACAMTLYIAPKVVNGTSSLVSGTPSTATISSLPFTAINSYSCVVTNSTTAADGLKVGNVSASSIIVTGPNTVSDSFNFVCNGN